MNHTVPIYLCNVKLSFTKKSGRISTVTRHQIENKIIVKGYNLEDIRERKTKIFERKYGQIGETCKIENIEFLSQHGFGIDE